MAVFKKISNKIYKFRMNMSILAEVKSISIYPVKSIGGIELEKAIVTPFGLAHPENHEVIDR